MMIDEVRRQLASVLNEGADHLQVSSVGGGSINHTYQLKTRNGQQYFCKVNSATKFPHLFSKEKEGLEFLEKGGIVRTPKVIDCFTSSDQQFLLLEWINRGATSAKFWKAFGEQLASLHRVHHQQFGWQENNYMGSVPQLNNWSDKWHLFLIEQRLKPIVAQCAASRLLSTRHEDSFERLYSRVPSIFNEEKPSLLHGDLWSGNYMCDEDQRPVLIDPAIYFGHRSVDLAMTTLFGGFEPAFYDAYNYHFPLPSNRREQWAICNLYPLLIHLLLFGTSYLYQIEEILKEFDT